MKKLYTILLLMLSISSIAQTQNGINWGQYYITGSLTVGQGVTNSWAHSSALFQVGKDTSLKGYRLAWVTDTGAITGTKIFGLQVWQWKDSSEYVWLGTRWRPVVKPTSSGSGSADSLVFSTNYRVDTFRTRVNTVLNTKVNTSDYNSLFDSRLSLKTTDNVAEGANKYYTDTRARAAISLTTTGTSGSATYNSSTGVLNIPSYAISAETDTTLYSTRAWRKKGDDSLGAIIATKVGYSDTATMLSTYLRKADTISLSNRINLKQGYADTSTWDATKKNLADTAAALRSAISSGSGSSGWGLTGNAGTAAGTNFIGTTDAQDVVVKRNSTEVARFASYGFKSNALNVGSGTTYAGTNNNVIGDAHTLNSGAQFGTVVGGYGNTVSATGYIYAMVGGSGNTIAGTNTTIVGGGGTSVAGTRCVAINGNGSFISTGATDCVTIGTAYTDGISKAVAIGTWAYAQHNGSMILADGQTTGYMTSNIADAFAAKFLNGYRFNLAHNVNAMQITANGNVSVGGSTPDASALFDMTSTTKGLGLPQMTTTQINAIASPKAGLIVYNTTLSTICFYNGTSWQRVTSSAM